MRRAAREPALLGERDLSPLREAAGDGALTYVLVLGAFHYINRMADLLHVESEILPDALRRFAVARRLAVALASRLFARMDLAPRTPPHGFEASLDAIAPLYERATGRPVGGDLDALRARPFLVDVLRASLEERERATLSRAGVARVHDLVERWLPRRPEDADGFHPRPADPFEAFVFVGTRYAARTTPGMLDALRAEGYDDLRLLDLAHAVADANQWARVHRLLGLERDILAPSGT